MGICRKGRSGPASGSALSSGNKSRAVQVGTGVTDWDEGTYEELEAFARHIQNHEQPLSNAHTASISTLIGIMGRKAMYNRRKNEFEPSVVTGETGTGRIIQYCNQSGMGRAGLLILVIQHSIIKIFQCVLIAS